jgi:4-hydroxy-tetrahydrodipicolinate synthase
MFTGSLVALITPMRADGAIDEDAYARLIEHQIANGTSGLIAVGTTGESPTLTHDEHRRCVALAVEVAARRVPVIAGAGSNSTAEAIGLATFAKHAGADAALVVTPYYNKPTQQGLYLHYTAIADAADLPIIIYNIPPRSVIDMSPATMARLAQHPNIVGVKDSTANLARPLQTRLACGPDFCQLSGEDATAVAFLGAGGVGCISVTANLAPAACAQVQTLWRQGNVPAAIALQDQLMPLHEALFLESNPAPVKFGASLLGFGADHCRLPLAPLTDPTRQAVRQAMRHAGILP